MPNILADVPERGGDPMLFGISVYAFGEGDSQVKPVATVVKELVSSGIPYRTNAIQTVVEGRWDQVMPTIRKAYDKLAEDYDRVHMTVIMDDHRSTDGRLQGAVDDLEKELGHRVDR
jgi:uncharacterized protein YqgV (UPF0045/DUF77 family)